MAHGIQRRQLAPYGYGQLAPYMNALRLQFAAAPSCLDYPGIAQKLKQLQGVVHN